MTTTRMSSPPSRGEEPLAAPISILHIFGRMERAGAELRTLDLLRNIDRERFRFHFCALSGQPGVLDEEIRALGGEVHLLPLGARFGRQFRQLLQEHHFDIVHSHVHYFSGYVQRLAAQEAVGGRITHFRISDDGKGGTLRQLIQRKLTRRWVDTYSTHILAVSKGTMSEAWSQDWERDPRCRVIYNGLDTALFQGPDSRRDVRLEFGLPEDSNLYLHVGRMDEQKNHKRVLSIFREIANTDSLSYLLLVGRGGNEIEEWLRERASEWGIAERVVFAGVRSDIPRLLKAADLMLFPSLREGLPGAVLEAAATSTPVLASDISGVVEIASYLPVVRYLPLKADDHEWARAARSQSAAGKAHGARTIAARAFASSPFTIEKCAASHCMTWEDAGSRG